MDISNLSAYQGLLSSQISNQKTNELKGVLNNAAEKTDDELMDACKEFEAYFLEQVFKGMEKTVVKADNSSSSMDTMVDFYKDELYKKLAKTSTETSSIGLAKQMYEQMKRNYSVKPATDETESI